MILTITYEKQNASDLGYLLHKNPYRPQSVDISKGKAYIFYPEISDTSCTVSMVLDINSVNLVRKSKNSIFDYVNDRPYTSSSFLSVAIAKVFSTALSGICQKRPELVDEEVPIQASLTMVPCKGGKKIIYDFFASEPLKYQVEVVEFLLDENHPHWGKGNYYNITIKKKTTIKEVLRHIYILVPSLDIDKHYFVSENEIDKLERYGEPWIQSHPFKEEIISRYMIKMKSLYNQAVKRLLEDSDEKEEEKDIEKLNTKLKLNKLRMNAVVEAILNTNTSKIIDLGCGEGKLIGKIINNNHINKITGVDISYSQLERAKKRLRLDELAPNRRDKVKLIQGSLTYIDERFQGYDLATLIEVIEHIDYDRLWMLEKNIFENARPKFVIVTTPNKEYNEYYGMKESNLRHPDHRFEWSRNEFESWCLRITKEYRYDVTFKEIGETIDQIGAPTQMGVFALCK